ncbi:MAG: hypothetical protein AB1696_28145 [Planctomycetota bacterium]
MKAMALADRLKEKDAYDIYYTLTNYPGGIEKVVEKFRPHIRHGLVREGLAKLAEHFGSVDAVGPAHVANFAEISDEEERDRVRRDAFEKIHYLLTQLG